MSAERQTTKFKRSAKEGSEEEIQKMVRDMRENSKLRKTMLNYYRSAVGQ